MSSTRVTFDAAPFPVRRDVMPEPQQEKDRNSQEGLHPTAETQAPGSVQDDPGLVQEFVWFLRYNKRWWLTPIVVIVLLLAVLAVITSTPAGPFIYTLF